MIEKLKFSIFLTFILICTTVLKSQHLDSLDCIPNGYFEKGEDSEHPTYWYNPSKKKEATPDFFCKKAKSKAVNIPTSFRSSNAMVGLLLCDNNDNLEHREYYAIKLQNLKSGKASYQLKLKLSHGRGWKQSKKPPFNSRTGQYTCSKISVLLTKEKLEQKGQIRIEFPLEYLHFEIPLKGHEKDWVDFSQIICFDKDYKYLTIGNFASSNTNIRLDTTDQLWTNHTYLYIEQIHLISAREGCNSKIVLKSSEEKCQRKLEGLDTLLSNFLQTYNFKNSIEKLVTTNFDKVVNIPSINLDSATSIIEAINSINKGRKYEEQETIDQVMWDSIIQLITKKYFVEKNQLTTKYWSKQPILLDSIKQQLRDTFLNQIKETFHPCTERSLRKSIILEDSVLSSVIKETLDSSTVFIKKIDNHYNEYLNKIINIHYTPTAAAQKKDENRPLQRSPVDSLNTAHPTPYTEPRYITSADQYQELNTVGANFRDIAKDRRFVFFYEEKHRIDQFNESSQILQGLVGEKFCSRVEDSKIIKVLIYGTHKGRLGLVKAGFERRCTGHELVERKVIEIQIMDSGENQRFEKNRVEVEFIFE